MFDVHIYIYIYITSYLFLCLIGKIHNFNLWIHVSYNRYIRCIIYNDNCRPTVSVCVSVFTSLICIVNVQKYIGNKINLSIYYSNKDNSASLFSFYCILLFWLVSSKLIEMNEWMNVWMGQRRRRRRIKKKK